MLEIWCGCFHLMLSVKGVTVACEGETVERKNLFFIYGSFRKSLVFAVEGEDLLLGTSQTLNLSMVASA